MKFIVSFLAATFCLGLAIAQEESPAPAESTAPATEEKATEEKPSATVESTPATAPSPTTIKKAEKAEAASSASPASATKKETTTTATKPATGTVAATNGKKMSVKDMENAWEASVATHNFASVSGYIASDFVGISSQGKFVDKGGVLAEYKKDKDTYKSAKNEKLNVKNFGPNVTVVTGRAREVGTSKDGKAFDRTYLFTDTWMLRGGQWQCVASHISKIKG